MRCNNDWKRADDLISLAIMVKEPMSSSLADLRGAA
jgi:hypothetical protein